MPLLQLESMLRSVHDQCLHRSQDPNVQSTLIQVYPSLSTSNSVEITDLEGQIQVLVEVDSSVFDKESTQALITNILGPMDSAECESWKTGRMLRFEPRTKMFSQTHGLRSDDQWNYTEILKGK